MEDKPKRNVLRTVLIVLGVLALCCVLVYASGFVLMPLVGPLLEQQAGLLNPVVQETPAEPAGDETPTPAALGTDFFAPFETTPPTLPPTPTSTSTGTPTMVTPSATPTQALPSVASCVPPGERVRALVTKILSGDTIQVVIREQTYMVRYIGIRSPALGLQSEPYALEAALANQSLVQNQVVTLIKDASDVDADGASLVRYVFVNDIFVNYDMISRGMAQADSIPPNTSCDAQFQLAQQEAMENRRGMWQEGVPVEPPPDVSTPETTEQALAETQPCDCKGPDLQCDDFATRADAQACFDFCKAQGLGDIFLMDSNGNGAACEDKRP